MDTSKIISSLNDDQRLAVSAPSRAMLVLAGAGSGKTRVLVHRIVWQIQVEGISPYAILAVTFTNKAATEMRNRIEALLETPARSLWIGTFHGLAHRLLRRHAKAAQLPETFQVMDSDDQLRIIKRLMKELNIDESGWPPKQLQWYINAQKDEGIRAKHMVEPYDFFNRGMWNLYRAYEDFCQRTGLVDFAELLLRAHELLRDNAELLEFYRKRFQHVHVDEFQDTNTIQYAWLRLLTQDRDNLFVVGDDDQSIYGWRGAKIENIRNFRQHYPNHEMVKLERNYRSTGHILKAANSVIANNEDRLGKELWTDAGDGTPISLYAAFNEQDEAYFVVERIRQWLNDGAARSDIAILYRSNVQSRQFEEKLMTTGIPYRVYGGLRFFERAEIKNALAYLRLASNRHDDASFERVVNTPTRGIGAKSLDDIRQAARDQRISLWSAAEAAIGRRLLSSRTANALAGFLTLIDELQRQTRALELFEQVKTVVERSGLIEFYNKSKDDKREMRVENLEELVNAARQFVYEPDNEENLNALDMFLAHAALEAGEAQGADSDDCVQLMTLHSAKGLEFKRVFLVGLEEGLFPSQQSVEEPGRLEEERRLCYVGMTRAMENLTLTYAESRRLYGRETNPEASRFLREIPAETLQEVRIRANINRPVTARAGAASLEDGRMYRLGQRVRHASFGEGVVLQMKGSGAQEQVQINFREAGMKWLMLSYAKLETL
ncbi:MAG: DNA helicase II [Gammaproteobacteria bacterium]